MKLRAEMPELSGAAEWLNGEVTKDQLTGDKPTIIHFWSVSCQICKEEMPEVNRFRDQFRDHLNIVAVHIPRSDDDTDLEEIKRKAAANGITQPICIDSSQKLHEAFGNSCVPAYYVFDKTGVLRHSQVGKGGKRILEQRIKRVLMEAEQNG